MDEEAFQMFEHYDFQNDQSFQAGWKAIVNFIDPEKIDTEYVRAKAFYYARNVSSLDFALYLYWTETKKQKTQTDVDLESQDSVGKVDDRKMTSLYRDESKSEIVDNSSVQKQHCDSPELSSLEPRDICRHLPHSQGSVQPPQTNSENQPSLPVISSSSSSSSSAGILKSFSGKADIILNLDSECDGIAEGLGTFSFTEKPEVQNPEEDYVTFPDLGSSTSQETAQNLTPGESQNISEGQQLSLAQLAEFIQRESPIPGIISVDVQPTNTHATPSVMSRKAKPWEMKVKQDNSTLPSAIDPVIFS